MELRQLRYFRALEGELGTPLVNRGSRQLTLTPAGELVQQRALEILARVDRLGEDARLLERSGRRRAFRLGLETTILYGRFPELMRELRGANPQLHIDVIEMGDEKQFLALKEGRIDVGFGRTRTADPDIAQTNLRQEPLFAALSAHHPLADGAPAPLALSELAEQTFILFPAGAPAGHPSSLHALFAERGFRPREIIDASELQVALGLVAADYGVCIVPAAVQRMRGSDICYRLLDEPHWTSPILMSWLRSEQPLLVSSIQESLDKISKTTR